MAAKTLMVHFDNQLHKSQLPAGIAKQLTIGNDWSNDITFLSSDYTLNVEWDGYQCHIDGTLLDTANPLALSGPDSPCFYLTDNNNEETLDTAGLEQITFGNQPYHSISFEDLEIDFLLIRNEKNGQFQLEMLEGELYHNFLLIEDTVTIETGDQLFFGGVLVSVFDHYVKVSTSGLEMSSTLIPLTEGNQVFSSEYPNYHRSPRIIHREPEEKRVIAKPSTKPSKPSEQLGRTVIPPLVMIAALVIVSVIQPRGIFIIVMLSMTVTTVTVSVISYIKSVKKYNANMKHRDKTYREYLQRKTEELYRVTEEQRESLYYHYPDVKTIRDKTLQVDARIYEKTMLHHDFLDFRTGLGDIDPSFDIEFNDEEFTQDEDELMDMARDLYEQYQVVYNVPVVTTLQKGPVGFIGQRELVLEQLQQFVMQLALFHSYHDIQFVTIFPEEEKNKWNWMRWLPQANLQALNVRGFIYHERSRDQILHSLYQVLKERQLMLEEKENKNEKIHFSPHYVFLITDERLILDHTIMEFFNQDPSDLGVSLVFVQDVMHALPEHVTTVIDISDTKNGNIILEEGELVNKAFVPDHFPVDFNKEDVSRGLAPLHHLQTLKNSIPESVTFLEMYRVDRVEELDIATRWRQNETYKSMAVPLGLRGKDDIVELNLHEKAHGPHGLVAGTTGSGKSEIIQSYIISLAVNFHPYEVAFLLIDYKGGGMANLFRDMPHLLGTITNLDRAQALRALASIKAELQKRQRLFGEHDVNHINQYQKLYKQGQASEPMPHLYLISDEFAELKAEQPDFMQELVSTARIGRSLGIHLILATQKPSGVVDEQIWSNSKFKLALKVQNQSDSKEVLKTPDAAEITLPGRSYLQVGNNEIYELFQSAWSGADYVPDKETYEQVDTTIYAINDLGQYTILTEDLSGLDKQEAITSVPTELEAVIDYMHDYTEAQQIEPLPRPWLPPLSERLMLSELHPIDFTVSWKEPKKPLTVTVGMLDQPELQAQNPLEINLTKDGHIAVFSSPGYGKSTFLQTLAMDLTKQHSPAHMHIYLLDFGTNGLLPLKGMPHTAETLLLDETEKIAKWIRLMTDTIQTRKRKLNQYGVATLETYERASGEIIPNILVVLDNYDAVREADFVEEFDKLITQIAREGSGIGIHLAISAGRQNAMKMPLLSNIKLQLALYLIDVSEVRAIVGRTELEIAEIAGRGIIKLDQSALFQTALPADGEEALQVIENIQQVTEEMDHHWDGERPEGIPMMPEGAIDFLKFKENKQTKEKVEQNLLPLGLEFEEVMPLAYHPATFNFLTITSDRKDRLDSLTNGIAKNMTLLGENYETILIDTKDQSFVEAGRAMHLYKTEQEEIKQLKETLVNDINSRLQTKEDHRKRLILIKDVKDFAQRSQISEEEIPILLEQGATVGIHFVICGDYSFIGRSYEPMPKYVRRQSTIGVLAMKLGDQDIFNQPFIRKEKYPSAYECYYTMDQDHVKIKIPE